jgi:hypothetical protein
MRADEEIGLSTLVLVAEYSRRVREDEGIAFLEDSVDADLGLRAKMQPISLVRGDEPRRPELCTEELLFLSEGASSLGVITSSVRS